MTDGLLQFLLGSISVLTKKQVHKERISVLERPCKLLRGNVKRDKISVYGAEDTGPSPVIIDESDGDSVVWKKWNKNQ